MKEGTHDKYKIADRTKEDSHKNDVHKTADTKTKEKHTTTNS